MYLQHARGMALGRTACLRALRSKRVAAVQRAPISGSRRGPAPAACLHTHGVSDEAAGAPFTITTPLYYVNAGGRPRVGAAWRGGGVASVSTMAARRGA